MGLYFWVVALLTSPSLCRRIFFKMGLYFWGVASYPSPSLFRRIHFPRCCSVPLPECPEHSTRNTLPQRLWRGVGVRAAARSFKVTPSFILAEATPLPECPMRNTLPQRVGKRAAAPSLAVRWSRSFLLRLHPNGKRWSRLFLLRLHPNGKRCLFLLTLSFANATALF
jgi:hypothetical protein